jgi:hypothetical protein
MLLQRREAPTVRGFLLAVTHFLLMLLGLFGELFSLPFSLPPSLFNLALAHRRVDHVLVFLNIGRRSHEVTGESRRGRFS